MKSGTKTGLSVCHRASPSVIEWARRDNGSPARVEHIVKQSHPVVRFGFGRHGVRRRAAVAVLAIVLPLAASACSDDSTDGTGSTAAAAESAAPADDSGSTESTGSVDESVPAETSGPAETAAVGDGGDCSTVPAKDVVESIIGSAVLPVEYQEFTGCVYFGDGDNVGVYFEIVTDEQDLASFADPDPQFAVAVEAPGLPPGSFVQSGDFYAMQSGVLYVVSAGVTGTADDDQIATQLMVAWLALVP